MKYDSRFGSDAHLWRLLRTEITGATSDLDQYRAECRDWMAECSPQEAVDLYNECVDLLQDDDDSDAGFIQSLGAAYVLEMLSDRVSSTETTSDGE